MSLSYVLIQTLNGVQYGFLLFLVASGLTLVFGIMGVLNLAHGAFYMVGAYLALAAHHPDRQLPAGAVDRAADHGAGWVSWSSVSVSATSTSVTTCTRCCSPTG